MSDHADADDGTFHSDNENGIHIQSHLQQPYHRSNSHHHEDEDHEEEGTLEKLYDSTVNRPCQALGSCGTNATNAIENMSMCQCQPHRIHFFSVFGSTPTGHGQADGGVVDESPYLYSPSAPVGPVSCEYCGKANTEDCKSNLPNDIYDYYDENGGYNYSYEMNRKGSVVSGGSGGTSGDIGKQKRVTKSQNKNDSNDAHNKEPICPRPKLFFLKKKPPFATPDGWDPKTGYRENLLEPPSSMDARVAAWGEVRGAVGRGSMKVRQNGNYAGSGHGESEISFSSDGNGGAGGGRVAEKGERPTSPVTWVSGLLEKL